MWNDKKNKVRSEIKTIEVYILSLFKVNISLHNYFFLSDFDFNSETDCLNEFKHSQSGLNVPLNVFERAKSK